MATYYEVLGVTTTATHEEIKQAYKDASRKWHPDKNLGNNDAQEKFKAIVNAWEVLQDDTKRKAYDVRLLEEQAKLLNEKFQGKGISIRISNSRPNTLACTYQNKNYYLDYDSNKKDWMIRLDGKEYKITDLLNEKQQQQQQQPAPKVSYVDKIINNYETQKEFTKGMTFELEKNGINAKEAKEISRDLLMLIEKNGYMDIEKKFLAAILPYPLKTISALNKCLDTQINDYKSRETMPDLVSIFAKANAQAIKAMPIIELKNEFKKYKERIETAIQATKIREGAKSSDQSIKHVKIKILVTKLNEVESGITNGDYKNLNQIKDELKPSIDTVINISNKAQKNPFKKSKVAEGLKDVLETNTSRPSKR